VSTKFKVFISGIATTGVGLLELMTSAFLNNEKGAIASVELHPTEMRSASLVP
jgi:hypothetical protein